MRIAKWVIILLLITTIVSIDRNSPPKHTKAEKVIAVVVSPSATPTNTPEPKKPQPVEEPAPTPEAKRVLTTKQELMTAANIPDSEWGAVDYIVTHESGWNHLAVNYLGCIGLGQSCPGGSGLASDCPNWKTDQVCQLRHFSRYAVRRYGSWWNAYNFWTRNNWW